MGTKIASLRAFFLQEVTLPKSSPLRDATVLILLLLALSAYHLEDMYLNPLPANDLAGSIAGFSDFKRQWLSEGTLPLWLPTWFTGMFNVHSLTEFLLVFPLSLVAPAVTAYKVLALLAVAAGTVGVFRVLRKMGVDRSAAFVGGFVFFTHPLVLVEFRFFGHMAFLLTLAILPFLLHETYLLLQKGFCRWPICRASLMLAFVFALHPTMATMVAVMLVGVTFLTVGDFDSLSQWCWRASAILVVLFMAFALSAFASLPLWMESRNNLALFGQGEADGASASFYPVPSVLLFLDRMGALLAANENVRAAMGDTPLLSGYPISSGGCYLGWSVVVVTLAGALVSRAKEKGPSIFMLGFVWLLMAWLALGKQTVLASYRWLEHLGAYREAWMTLVLCLFLALWAVVLSIRARGRPGWRRGATVIGTVILIGVMVAVPVYGALQTVIAFFGKIRAPCQFMVPALGLLPLLCGAATHEIRSHLRHPCVRMIAVLVIMTLFVADFLPYRSRSLRDVAGFEPSRLADLAEFLKGMPRGERVFYSRGYSPVMDYTLSAKADKGSFSYWLNWGAPRHVGPYRGAMYSAFFHWLDTGDGEKFEALMAIANIRYVVNPCLEVRLPADVSLQNIHHNLLFDLYENRSARGVWQTYPAAALRADQFASWDEALVEAFRQQRALVVEEHHGPEIDRLERRAPGANQGRVLEWQRPTSRRCWVTVDFSEPGILMWAESYHPTWQVCIDGRRGEILRVNQAFLGVRIPRGQHLVVFEFGPYRWRWLGGLVSLAGVLVLLLGRWPRALGQRAGGRP